MIAQYKNDITILKMPKKGGTGLSESFENMAKFIDASVNHPENLEALKETICY